MAAEYDLLHQSHRSVIAAKVSVQNEIDSLLTQREQLRIDRPKWLDVTLSKRLEKLLAVTTADPLNRMELHAVFRSLFVKVVIDWEHDRLIFHWQHGGESFVSVKMKPQRHVANPRRADRRYEFIHTACCISAPYLPPPARSKFGLRWRKESLMKNVVLAALAILGIVAGTVSVAVHHANATPPDPCRFCWSDQ
jgi:hypothetical protein